ncbi:MAG: hypothetical protein JW747_04055, partial [Candidatus Aminicenantes bacterium]|nr:hypothetical protein [Candidatus Aminicenantes bacterium]
TNSLDLSKGAGTPSSAEKKATAAAVLTMLIFIAWQIANNLFNVPGAPVPAPAGGGGSEVPPGGGEDEPESYADRPAWSLIHRKDGDIFDDKNERWVSRDSDAGRAILEAKRKSMEEKGFVYDAERDAFVERSLIYDEASDSFRKPPDEPEPLEIQPEQDDASRMHIGPGWLIPGDPGTSSDPEVVNKSLNDRLRYLDDLEDDVRSEHEALNDRLKTVEKQKDKDPWLEEQLRQRREDLKQKMRHVQEQKLDLTRRVDERAREYSTWAERQKKSWTAREVAKELSEVVIPDPESLRPLFERTLELRNRLQKAINEQPALFSEVDATIARMKQVAADMQSARERGDLAAVRSFQSEMDAARARLQEINNEMQAIHKKSAQWQAGSHVLTATAGMTATDYIGKAKMVHEVGKGAVKFLKPEPGFKRPSVFEPAKGGRSDREFFVVDKSGKIREIKGADAADYRPKKGELVVSRDPYSGKLTEQEFGAGGRGQPLTDGQKSLLRQQAQKGLADKAVRPLETGRKYAGPSGVTTAEDGSVTYAPAEEKPPWTPAKPAEAAVPPSREEPDLRKLVPKRDTFRTQKARENMEKMIRGEEPDFGGAVDHPESAAGWNDRDWLRRQEAIKAGRKFENAGERLEYWKDQDPEFKKMDETFRKAQVDAQRRMIDEIKPDVAAQMKKEGWTPGSPGYEDELSRRIGADLRIHSGKKVQEYYFENLVKQKPDLEPFDERWYYNKVQEYSNKPIPDQPQVPASPPPRPKTSIGPVEGLREPDAGGSAPGAPSGHPPMGKTFVPPAPGEPAPGPGGPPAGKTFVPPAPGEPSAIAGQSPPGKTAIGPPPAAAADEPPMASFEPPESAVPPEAAPRAQPQTQPTPQGAQPSQPPSTSAPSSPPHPAASTGAASPSRGPAPPLRASEAVPEPDRSVNEFRGADVSSGKAPGAPLSARERIFGARAETLESVDELKDTKLEDAVSREGGAKMKDLRSEVSSRDAAAAESAKADPGMKEARSSLSSREVSEGRGAKSAGLKDEVPLHAKHRTFARMLQDFLRNRK